MVTAAFWRDRPTFVTGATGLVGGWLVRRLLDARRRRRLPRARLGARSRSSCRSGLIGARQGRARRRARPARCSSARSASTRSTRCSTSRPRRSSAIANRNPVSTFETNIAGTWALLEACRRSPTVRQIVVASSDKAYGDHERAPVRRGRAAAGAPPVRREQVVRRPDRHGLRGDLRPAGRDHALRQLLRRRRPELEPHRAGHDPLGAPRRAAGHPLRRHSTFATTSTSRTAPPRTLLLAEWLAANPRARGEAFNFSNEDAGHACSSWSSRILALMGSAISSPRSADEATQRDPRAVPGRREGARRARLAARCSASTRACGARSTGTADFLERRREHGRRRCRSCGATDLEPGSLARRARRSRTRCSTAEQLDEPEPTYPLDLCLLPRVRARPDHRDGAAGGALPRLPLLLVVLRHDAAARDGARRRGSSPSAGSAGDSLVVEVGEQRRLPARSTTGSAACRCSASSRRETSRRSPRSAASRRSPEFFDAGARASGSSARARRADVLPRATTCSRTSPDLNGFVAGHRDPARGRRRRGDRGAVREGHARPLRVRHDLPRAPLLLLAHRARRAVRAPWPRGRRRRADPDPRRLAARCSSQHAGRGDAVGRQCSSLRREEERWGVRETAPYDAFARRVAGCADELVGLLGRLKADGRRIAGVRCGGEGEHAAELLRDRRRDARLRRRPQHGTSQGRYMPGVRSADRSAASGCSRRCRTTSCCSPGTSPTRSSRQQAEYRATRRPVHRARARHRRWST